MKYLQSLVYYKSGHLRQSGLFSRPLPQSLLILSFRSMQAYIERSSSPALHIIFLDIGLAMSCCKDRVNGFGREFDIQFIYVGPNPHHLKARAI